MEQYIVIFIFFLIAMTLMLGSLKFSKYKERPGGTCGGDDCACDAAGKEIGDCEKNDEMRDKFLIDIKQTKL